MVEHLERVISFVDVLDRVLDKGVVVDARIRTSLGGLEMVTVDAHIVIASCATALKHSKPPGLVWFRRPIPNLD